MGWVQDLFFQNTVFYFAFGRAFNGLDGQDWVALLAISAALDKKLDAGDGCFLFQRFAQGRVIAPPEQTYERGLLPLIWLGRLLQQPQQRADGLAAVNARDHFRQQRCDGLDLDLGVPPLGGDVNGVGGDQFGDLFPIEPLQRRR